MIYIYFLNIAYVVYVFLFIHSLPLLSFLFVGVVWDVVYTAISGIVVPGELGVLFIRHGQTTTRGPCAAC